MQRSSKRTQIKYCKNCHITLACNLQQIHQSYCHISTPKCSKCIKQPILCNKCQILIPSCQDQSHKLQCDNRSLKNRNNSMSTICPYCRRITNINDVLKHLDKCIIKRNQRVLSDNVDIVHKEIKDSNRQDETSIQKHKHHKARVSFKIHQNLGHISRNNTKHKFNQKIECFTQKIIPLEIKQSNKQFILFQHKIITPIPLFLRMNGFNHSLLSSIKPIAIHRQNIGKLSKNY